MKVNAKTMIRELGMLGAAFGQEVGKERQAIYARKLGHLTEAQFQRAIHKAYEEAKFFPAIADLLKWSKHSPQQVAYSQSNRVQLPVEGVVSHEEAKQFIAQLKKIGRRF